MLKPAIRSVPCVLLLGSFLFGICQQPNSSDILIYERFLRDVAQFAGLADGDSRNYQPSLLAHMLPQRAIGLTDQESVLLNAAATDCEARSRSLDNALRPLVLESRFQAIESGASSSSLPRRLKALDEQRTQMVMVEIQTLRVTFGEERFRVLETFVKERKDASSFFPLPKENLPIKVKK